MLYQVYQGTNIFISNFFQVKFLDDHPVFHVEDINQASTSACPQHIFEPKKYKTLQKITTNVERAEVFEKQRSKTSGRSSKRDKETKHRRKKHKQKPQQQKPKNSGIYGIPIKNVCVLNSPNVV